MYALDFRRRVLSIKESEKLSFAKAAKRFKVGIASLVRGAKKVEPTIKRNKPATKSDMAALKRDIKQYPDAYQYERAQRLGVSQMGSVAALKRLGVTYKKNLNHPKADQEKRSAYGQKIEEHKKEEHPIVFIDESGFSHDMTQTRGYAAVFWRS